MSSDRLTETECEKLLLSVPIYGIQIYVKDIMKFKSLMPHGNDELSILLKAELGNIVHAKKFADKIAGIISSPNFKLPNNAPVADTVVAAEYLAKNMKAIKKKVKEIYVSYLEDQLSIYKKYY